MTSQEQLQAFQMRLSGSTYAEIALRFRISRQRIQQILSPPEEVRAYVVHRAQGLCQECGILVGVSGQVHHSKSIGSSLDLYNDIDNLVLLCPSCHRNKHNDEDRISAGEAMAAPTCLRCGHQWTPRKPGRPHVCPNPECHSVKWDEPKDRVKIESK